MSFSPKALLTGLRGRLKPVLPKHFGMALGVLLTGFLPAERAWSQADLFSRESFTGYADLRIAATTGEKSWVGGDFGKVRFDGADDGKIRPTLSGAGIAWRPKVSWAWSATFHAEMQDGVPLDLIQAYVSYKPTPTGPTRFQARAGLFWPEISLEHEGALWNTAHTLTPSAINSWVGEELKVAAVEATVRRPIGEHEFSATAAVFDYNDTSGTLLSFRGWALHDLKAPTFSEWELPPLDNFIRGPQPRETYPVRKLDKRIGYYGRLEWRPPMRATVSLFFYDNLGNKIAVDKIKQWSWATQFWNVGLNVAMDDRTRLLSQFMTGRTLMGKRGPKTIWVDVDFTSAYVLLNRKLGEADELTGRVDWFTTEDNAPQSGGFAHVSPIASSRAEDGWAFTAAYKHTLNANAALFFEAMRVASDRQSRILTASSADRSQVVVQSALRLSF